MAAGRLRSGAGDNGTADHGEEREAPPGPARPTADDVRQALHAVVDPELGDDIVDLGMVRRVDVSPAGAVNLSIALTIAGCPLRAQIEGDVRGRVSAMEGVTSVEVSVGQMDAAERAAVMARARWK
ncbi:MAG: metal-sulfur cluster assembly factor, partial [Acidimicrobiales bacterium]